MNGWRESLAAFGRIGLESFGGPAAQIAVMHRVAVEERKWVDDASFQAALGFCTLLPGPEAMQVATWLGWARHGTLGALAAGLLFVLPGAVVMLALSAAWAVGGDVSWVTAAFAGLQAAVLAVVVEALVRLGRRALKRGVDRGIAVAAFLALAAFGIPFPVIVLTAAVVGWVVGSPAKGGREVPRPAVGGTLWTFGAGLIVWWLPYIPLRLALGAEARAVELFEFMSGAAVVTFGGAYAVLAHTATESVARGWLLPNEMAVGLGLAETTPGPLILVLEFVAFQAGFRSDSGLGPWAGGTLGAAVALWATFAPCFVWILAGAPWISYARTVAAWNAAIAGISAAVVGVVAHLGLWFLTHVWFSRTSAWTWGPLNAVVPDVSSWDLPATSVSVIACVALLRWHVPMIPLLAGGLVVGLLRGAIG